RDAGIQYLPVQAVGVEVAETRRRVEAPRTDLVVAQAGRAELEVAQSRGGRQAERAQLLAVVERPHVAVRTVKHLRRPHLESRGDAILPEVGRLVHVRIGVDDRVVDAGDLEERFGHLCLHHPSSGVNIGATTVRSMPEKRSGRNTTWTGMSQRSAPGEQSTIVVTSRTAGSSSRAIRPVTNGRRSASWGIQA